MSERGRDGRDGRRGLEGPQGIPGEKGDPGRDGRDVDTEMIVREMTKALAGKSADTEVLAAAIESAARLVASARAMPFRAQIVRDEIGLIDYIDFNAI